MNFKILAILSIITSYSVSAIPSGKLVNIEDFSTFSQQVIFLGEGHDDIVTRKQLKNSLRQFQQEGITDLALEMFKDNHQPILDKYCLDIDRHKKELIETIKLDWGYDINSYYELFEEACLLGIKIHAIDLPKKLLPKEIRMFPVPPTLSLRMKARDKRMAKNISTIVESSRGKIVVLAGYYHIDKGSIPKILENSYYINSVSLLLKAAPNFKNVDGTLSF